MLRKKREKTEQWIKIGTKETGKTKKHKRKYTLSSGNLNILKHSYCLSLFFCPALRDSRLDHL
jgi:hypothetical protein